MIINYLEELPENEMAVGYDIRRKITEDGVIALKILNTRQLKGKLWEIKFSQNRIMYIVQDGEIIYFLHACKNTEE